MTVRQVFLIEIERMRQLSIAFVITAMLISVEPAGAGSWSQFRGPNASGSADDSHTLPAEIGPDKNVVWKTELPPGHSSPALCDDRIFVTAEEGDRLFTLAIDPQTGHTLWKQEAEHERLEEIHSIGSHAQPSPTTDGERVVSLFGSYGLLCYDIDGKLLWKRPLGPFKNNYGAASSPIIVGELVVTNQDHDIDSFLMAVNKRTGETVWQTPRPEFPRGFSTPVVWDNGGQKQIVVVGSLRVAGYNLDDGHEAWTVRGLARIATMTPTVGDDGILYVTEWAPGGDNDGDRIHAEPYETVRAQYDKDNSNTLERNELPDGPLRQRFDQIDRDKDGKITPAEYSWMEQIFNSAQNVAVAIKPGAKGDATETHVLWKQTKQLPYVPSPVYYDAHLYMVKNGGIVSCLDTGSGQPAKQARISQTANYYSSPVVGDGKLYLVNQKGEVTVLSAEPHWKVLATSELGEEVFATPAITDGRIYLRTAGHLYCFGIAK